MHFKNDHIFILGVFFFLLFSACTPKQKFAEPVFNSSLIHRLNAELTHTIIQDGFSPPVAARAYALSNIAAFEIGCFADKRFQSLAGQLNKLENLPKPDSAKAYYFEWAMVEAFCTVAQSAVYRDYLLDTLKAKFANELLKDGNPQTIKNSTELGQIMAEAIKKWAASDGYSKTRKFPLFTPKPDPGAWQPTPPNYAEAIEPYWGRIRPFVLDSANQFLPTGPASFSEKPQSEFFKLAKEVYEVVNQIDSSRLCIAKHWDCNPYVSINNGHMMYGKRQLTPGGHWMGITRISAVMKDLDVFETTEAYTLVAISLSDAFISCWDEKYRSNLIRPETYINQYIDPKWRPVLETPTFPEHTSGHSVISSSASTMLTSLFGDDFAYVDSVNVPFGLPPRPFQSFYDASSEAAISRFYGGIHYMPAITLGVDQGKNVGTFIVKKVKTRRE